ncbi:MAG TPA: GNAT family N-acetyltransferase, partial [Anaerolineae bacterium]
DAMDAAYGPYLRVQLTNGTTRAWVIVDGDRRVASGALLFADWLPRPDGHKPGLAYVHSVYTEPGYRRIGLARRILKAMIAECRMRGLPRLTLHASEMGRPLYESLGFADTNEMRLTLD